LCLWRNMNMLVKRIEDVEAVPVDMEGAKDVTVRVLFGPKDSAPTFAMRVFELDGGGHTPYHEHPFEHEVVILEGDIAVVSKDGETPVKPGNVVLVMPNEVHQFRNMSESNPAKLMCLVPVEYQK